MSMMCGVPSILVVIFAENAGEESGEEARQCFPESRYTGSDDAQVYFNRRLVCDWIPVFGSVLEKQ
jgi:hypothetical protein